MARSRSTRSIGTRGEGPPPAATGRPSTTGAPRTVPLRPTTTPGCRLQLSRIRSAGRSYYSHVRLTLPSGKLLSRGSLRSSWKPCRSGRGGPVGVRRASSGSPHAARQLARVYARNGWRNGALTTTDGRDRRADAPRVDWAGRWRRADAERGRRRLRADGAERGGGQANLEPVDLRAADRRIIRRPRPPLAGRAGGHPRSAPSCRRQRQRLHAGVQRSRAAPCSRWISRPCLTPPWERFRCSCRRGRGRARAGRTTRSLTALMAELAGLTLESFGGRIGERFQMVAAGAGVETPAVELRLSEAAALGKAAPGLASAVLDRLQRAGGEHPAAGHLPARARGAGPPRAVLGCAGAGWYTARATRPSSADLRWAALQRHVHVISAADGETKPPVESEGTTVAGAVQGHGPLRIRPLAQQPPQQPGTDSVAAVLGCQRDVDDVDRGGGSVDVDPACWLSRHQHEVEVGRGVKVVGGTVLGGVLHRQQRIQRMRLQPQRGKLGGAQAGIRRRRNGSSEARAGRSSTASAEGLKDARGRCRSTRCRSSASARASGCCARHLRPLRSSCEAPSSSACRRGGVGGAALAGRQRVVACGSAWGVGLAPVNACRPCEWGGTWVGERTTERSSTGLAELRMRRGRTPWPKLDRRRALEVGKGEGGHSVCRRRWCRAARTARCSG